MEIDIDGNKIKIDICGFFKYKDFIIHKSMTSIYRFPLEPPDYESDIDLIRSRIDVVDAILNGELFDHLINNTFYYYYYTLYYIIRLNKSRFISNAYNLPCIRFITNIKYEIIGLTRILFVEETYDGSRFTITLTNGVKGISYMDDYNHEIFKEVERIIPLYNEILGKHLIGNSVKSALY